MDDSSDAWDPKTGSGYVNLAAGIGKATRERALTAVRGLLAQAGLDSAAENAGERITKLTDEVFAASRANRELMAKLIAGEVEKVADQWGFARKDELDQLRREVTELRVGLARQTVRTEQAVADLGDSETDEPTPDRKSTAKKAATKKAPSSTPAKTAAQKTAAKKAATKKATAKKATAKKATTKKATTKKATTSTAPADSTDAEPSVAG